MNNPLDLVEEIIEDNEWEFDRSTDDELILEIKGQWSKYYIYFVWSKELSAVLFSCIFDFKVPTAKNTYIAELLSMVNQRLWIGFFILDSDDAIIEYRHTMLLSGSQNFSKEQVEDLINSAIYESERFYPAFKFVLENNKTPAEAISAALLETDGEA